MAGRPPADGRALPPAGGLAVAVALLTALVFLPALANNFVAVWDDGANVLSNLHYRGLGRAQLAWMFTTMHMGHYHPLTWITLGADHLVWGMRPAGYHLTSVLFHAAGALVFHFVSLRLLRQAIGGTGGAPDASLRLGAAFAALLFALHPLRVESVAWVSERRDVVSGLFYLLTILAYLKWCAAPAEGARRRIWYVASVGLFALALLGKSIAVSLPLVLLVLDVYPLRRLGGRAGFTGRAARTVWAEKIPFVVLSAASALLAMLAAHRLGQLAPVSVGLGERVAVSLYSLAFYLGKTLAPVGLSPLYERPIPLDPLGVRFVVSGAIVLLLAVAVLATRRRGPALAAASVAYVVTLAPVLGLVQTAHHLAADRYTYLACLGWALLGGGLLARMTATTAGRRRACIGVAAAVLLVLVALTERQLPIWRDSVTLWTSALAQDPSSTIAARHLGQALLEQGDLDGALAQARRAVALGPGQDAGWVTLGIVLATRAEGTESLEAFRNALRINPGAAPVWVNVGLVHLGRRELPDALAAFARALEIDPTLGPACANGRRVAAILGATHPALDRCATGR